MRASIVILRTLIYVYRCELLPGAYGDIAAVSLGASTGYIFAYFVASATSYQAVYAILDTTRFFYDLAIRELAHSASRREHRMLLSAPRCRHRTSVKIAL